MPVLALNIAGGLYLQFDLKFGQISNFPEIKGAQQRVCESLHPAESTNIEKGNDMKVGDCNVCSALTPLFLIFSIFIFRQHSFYSSRSVHPYSVSISSCPPSNSSSHFLTLIFHPLLSSPKGRAVSWVTDVESFIRYSLQNSVFAKRILYNSNGIGFFFNFHKSAMSMIKACFRLFLLPIFLQSVVTCKYPKVPTAC
jgi:hypothetical protein